MITKIENFLSTLDRSPKTLRAYYYALMRFASVVGHDAVLDTDTYIKFLLSIKKRSASTQRVYRTAVLKFYAFQRSGNWGELKEATDHYTHKQGKRIINFNREEIEKVIDYCNKLSGDLLALRDRAFVLTLVDTGLRISEACSLKRGDINWKERYAIIIGKGDKQAVVHFSVRATNAIMEYLKERSKIDPNSRTPLSSQPVFARHDITASKKIKPVGAGGMWKAIKGTPDGSIIGRITESGVDRKDVRVHDFRHYFITMTYLSEKDLKLSQVLARHSSSQTTSDYTHFSGEVQEAYDRIFNKVPK